MTPSATPQSGMTKAVLRKQFLAERKALTPGEVKRRSQRIAWHFVNYFENQQLADQPALVHTFLPIRRHNEVDTWPIINCLWAKFSHINISVSVTDLTTGRLTHYTLLPDTPLVDNVLGIPEPLPDQRQETDLRYIIAVLVPLLAFDRQGNRVGYGGGYYDRFLAENVPNSQRIGLSLFEPVDRIEDIEPTDVPLDVCITPERIWHFDSRV